MSRVSVPLVAVLSFVFCAGAFGQTSTGGAQIVRPGVPTPSAPQAPRLPPRDNPNKPQTGTARLRGRVVAAQTGAPLRRAEVSVTLAEAQLRRVTTTDGDGRYEFKDLPGGRLIVSASKSGYVTLQYGQKRPFEAGTPVNIAEGESLDRIEFALPRGSVIAVRITDDFGEPLAGVQVQVQRYQYGPDGQRRLTSTPIGSGMPFSGTDDRGEFRAYGLMPGEFIVSATIRTLRTMGAANSDDNSEGLAPTFYPGTISASEAQAISVGIGEETSVQFSLVAARLARISGTVVDSDGHAAAGAQLLIATRDGMSSAAAGTVARDGSFSIGSVAPGEHWLDVRQQGFPGNTAGGESASIPIVVSDSDISGLRVVTSKGTTITGRVVLSGTSARTGATMALQVITTPAEPLNRMVIASSNPTENGTVDDAGNFRIAGASRRVFFNFVTTPPDWMLKSVTLNGDDITDEPLDLSGKSSVSGIVITLTDKLTDISGQVTDSRGQPLRDCMVVIQPAEPKEPPTLAARLLRVVRPDTNGRFQARGMRPGRYVATAIESIEQGRQFAPEFQQQLRRSGRELSLRDGETMTLDLKLTPDL